MRRLGFRYLVLGIIGLAATVSLTTCGIETVATLQPPIFTSTGAASLSLIHNTANSDSTSCKGYDIYYRAYATQANADSARQAVEQATAASTASPETVLALLQTSGFTRIFDANGLDGANGTRPLFYVSASEIATAVTYQIQLDSTPSSSPNSTATLSGSNSPLFASGFSSWYFTRSVAIPTTRHVSISRSISTSNSPVSFESNYSPTDADYNGSGQAANSTLYFVFFAVVYGLDTSSGSFSFLYSFPTSLFTSVPYTLSSPVQ